jgi:hypothetical protein
VIAALAIPASRAHAQGDTATVSVPSRWHLYAGFGMGGAGGTYGTFLEEPLNFELRIAKSTLDGRWRYGGGLQFGSMNMKPPYDDQEEWAHLETFASATRVFSAWRDLRPYLQGRAGIVRIHPRSELFWFDTPNDLEPGESPTHAANGFGLTVQGGFEWNLRPDFALDVAGFYEYYNTSAYSLIPPLTGPVTPAISSEDAADSGQEWGVRAGLAWQPFAATPRERPRPAIGDTTPLPPPDAWRDAWGVRRSLGWATAEMLAINFGASMFNEYVRNANFNQISPRSFWSNLETGFTYDDNKFKTNQLIHPFNGSTYYSAARSNGLDFWASSVMAITGAFVWECCGETHPMSFNDMISTGIGGIARGELARRVSSLILDNRKTGGGRVGTEAGAFAFDPIRGFNRLVTGDAIDVKGNPSDPYDWRPPYQLNLRSGFRMIGEGESISDSTNTYGVVEASLVYGDPFDPERNRPFDRFDAAMQVNIGDKTRVGRLVIRGDIVSASLAKDHSLAFQQDFDYIDNEAYEYGGQSLGGALISRFPMNENYRLVTRAQVFGILLGAVNSNLSFLADVANQERVREYDFGPGVGAGAELHLLRKARPFVSARYRYSYIDVSNGSVYNNDLKDQSLNSSHDIHQSQLRLDIPVSPRVSAGIDGLVFFRKSRYDVTGSGWSVPPGRRTVTQRNPEIRAFVGYVWGL